MASMVRRRLRASLLQLGQRRVSRAASRGRRADSDRLTVILAAEEQWEGGSSAVTTWVREVCERLPIPSTVWTPDGRRSDSEHSLQQTADPPSGPTVQAAAPQWYRLLAQALRGAAGLAGKLTGRSADNIYRLALCEGRMWVWAIAPHVAKSRVIHVHNRPSYVAWLRRLGVAGTIILHAHNDLVGSAQAAARSSLSGMSPAEIVSAADHIVFCSEYLLTRAEDEFGPLPASVVHNGVSLDAAAQPIQPRKAHTAMWAGRLIPEKGALEAAAALEALDGTDWTLTLYGGASGSGRSSYEREVRRRSEATGTVMMAGFIPHEALLREYSRYSVFLYPCQWPEPFGMVLVEAMAGGAVVIAANAGGIPEIIDDGRTGILLEADASPHRYAEVLRELTAEKLDAIRTAAAADVRDRFTWDATAARMEQVLASCVTDVRTGSRAHSGSETLPRR